MSAELGMMIPALLSGVMAVLGCMIVRYFSKLKIDVKDTEIESRTRYGRTRKNIKSFEQQQDFLRQRDLELEELKKERDSYWMLLDEWEPYEGTALRNSLLESVADVDGRIAELERELRK